MLPVCARSVDCHQITSSVFTLSSFSAPGDPDPLGTNLHNRLPLGRQDPGAQARTQQVLRRQQRLKSQNASCALYMLSHLPFRKKGELNYPGLLLDTFMCKRSVFHLLHDKFIISDLPSLLWQALG